MITYEYKVIPGPMTEAQLNTLGAEGWRLDAVLNLLTSMQFYMSRKTEEPDELPGLPDPEKRVRNPVPFSVRPGQPLPK